MQSEAASPSERVCGERAPSSRYTSELRVKIRDAMFRTAIRCKAPTSDNVHAPLTWLEDSSIWHDIPEARCPWPCSGQILFDTVGTDSRRALHLAFATHTSQPCCKLRPGLSFEIRPKSAFSRGARQWRSRASRGCCLLQRPDADSLGRPATGLARVSVLA